MQLGERQFTDGSTRPVCRSDDGRQYVLDDDGEPVYGCVRTRIASPSLSKDPLILPERISRILRRNADRDGSWLCSLNLMLS